MRRGAAGGGARCSCWRGPSGELLVERDPRDVGDGVAARAVARARRAAGDGPAGSVADGAGRFVVIATGLRGERADQHRGVRRARGESSGSRPSRLRSAASSISLADAVRRRAREQRVAPGRRRCSDRRGDGRRDSLMVASASFAGGEHRVRDLRRGRIARRGRGRPRMYAYAYFAAALLVSTTAVSSAMVRAPQILAGAEAAERGGLGARSRRTASPGPDRAGARPRRWWSGAPCAGSCSERTSTGRTASGW